MGDHFGGNNRFIYHQMLKSYQDGWVETARETTGRGIVAGGVHLHVEKVQGDPDHDPLEGLVKLEELLKRRFYVRLACNGTNDGATICTPAPRTLLRFPIRDEDGVVVYDFQPVDLPNLDNKRLEFAQYWPLPSGLKHKWTGRPWSGVLLDDFMLKPTRSEWLVRRDFCAANDLMYLFSPAPERGLKKLPWSVERMQEELAAAGYVTEIRDPMQPPDPEFHSYEALTGLPERGCAGDPPPPEPEHNQVFYPVAGTEHDTRTGQRNEWRLMSEVALVPGRTYITRYSERKHGQG